MKTALVRSPLTKAHQIGVTTSKGVVLLSGFVDSNDQRAAATSVAQSVQGVKAVDKSVSLKPPP